MTYPGSTATSGESTPSKISPSFHPSSHINIIKLNRQNYHLWKAQILHYLRGQGIFGYVNGTIKPPPATIVSDGQTSENPAYEAWVQQDNLILSIITSSLSEEVLMQVYTANTSAAIWTAIETCFSSQSWAKLMQLRTQLASTRKGTQTAIEYNSTVKRLADDLAMAGHPLATDDIVAYLVAGLGPEYDALVTMLSVRDSVSLEEAYSLLLPAESRIQHHSPAL